MTEKNWMVFDYEAGCEFFECEDDAEAYAEGLLSSYRDDACEGWDDGVEQIIIAKVKRKIAPPIDTKLKEGDMHYDNEFDFIRDYKFMTV